MTNVIVVASGDTERAALPFLTSGLKAEGICLSEVRTPANGRMNAASVKKLIAAAYWAAITKPDLFVVLIDADGRDPLVSTHDLGEQLGACNVPTRVVVAAAKWHLEAWFFADPAGLRDYLQRELGSVDPAEPDEIMNPKLHLKKLLGGTVYTARMAGEIAARLQPRTIHDNSPSFRRFATAMRENG